MTTPCIVCKSNINTKKCAKCKTVQYCSRECQKKDWKNHKPRCITFKDSYLASVYPQMYELYKERKLLRESRIPQQTVNDEVKNENKMHTSVNKLITELKKHDEVVDIEYDKSKSKLTFYSNTCGGGYRPQWTSSSVLRSALWWSVIDYVKEVELRKFTLESDDKKWFDLVGINVSTFNVM